MRALPFAVALALAAATAGCETFGPATCDRSPEGNPPVRYTEGTVTSGVYATSAWDGELLYFPGGMRYDLVHGLPSAPRWVESFLSFDQYGTREGGTLAPAAGNQVVVTGVDATSVHVANDSCVQYWLRVAAGSGAP